MHFWVGKCRPLNDHFFLDLLKTELFHTIIILTNAKNGVFELKLGRNLVIDANF